LSALNSGITDANNSGFSNENAITMLGGVPRRRIIFRSIDSRIYANNMQDFTAMLRSPLEGGISEAEMQYRISMHPTAYTIGGYYQTKPMPFGTIVVIKKIGIDYFVINNISAPTALAPMNSFDHPPEYDTSKDPGLERKYGLKRTRKKYTGIISKYHGQTLYNGSLPYDILALPNKEYWTPMGSGGGAILADYVESFNAMAFAFYNHFGKKLRSSGIRSFRQQIINRRNSFPKSLGGNKKESAPCRSFTQRGGGCGTAIPGTSNHGWGQAVDIRKAVSSECKGSACFIQMGDKYHKWLLENAYKKGFAGRKWAHLGQPGTILSKQLKEAWHWEPIEGRVIK